MLRYKSNLNIYDADMSFYDFDLCIKCKSNE
ncbi:hypothetical protein QE382_001122 [Sphingobacterium zeae]|uniref:Uncharacterized protein n=1 Tax=Sphingobacterium zeae TaxID=1776859 RepID=A0ABU0U2G8_9SPHI|nr:hypothetical protein [Sphingobacterium zeae]